MLLKYFYDPAVAHASYLVGCQKTGEAVVVDPGCDIAQYQKEARGNGMKIVGVLETHIHADYVSGAHQMAHALGATLYVSDDGPAAWKYLYAEGFEHQLLKDGDQFLVGNLKFEVLHTPGHTPESICFLLTDQGGGADKPMGIFTGDFVFVGSIGRPDLLEEAAGISGTAEPGARDLFRSIQKFNALPDYLQLWPAHGAGSACGKGLGAIPSSTVGYEKQFNPALQIHDEQKFVDYILADQPEAPYYFAVMKRVNKEGPSIIDWNNLPKKLDAATVPQIAQNHLVIDTAPAKFFNTGHVPGTINIQMNIAANWMGWIVDYDKDVYVIAPESKVPELHRVMNKIGIQKIAGYFDPQEIKDLGLATETIDCVSPEEAKSRIDRGEVTLIDARGLGEWNQWHIDSAKRVFLGTCQKNLSELESEKPVLVYCKGGPRATSLISIAKASGHQGLTNMTGGIEGWIAKGLPVIESSEDSEVGCC